MQAPSWHPLFFGGINNAARSHLHSAEPEEFPDYSVIFCNWPQLRTNVTHS
jgi:hypothetical protein